MSLKYLCKQYIVGYINVNLLIMIWMLHVWTIQPSHEPLQKGKTETFHTEKHQGRENKGKGKGGENGSMKL